MGGRIMKHVIGSRDGVLSVVVCNICSRHEGNGVVTRRLCSFCILGAFRAKLRHENCSMSSWDCATPPEWFVGIGFVLKLVDTIRIGLKTEKTSHFTRRHTYIQACMHAYIHTYPHKYIHTFKISRSYCSFQPRLIVFSVGAS